ncbi:MAG TPA: 2-amino-4-hydroxy-6-hydroxymethyldihydropteridine diphosphokinase [Allosphingosinicella sp.]|uniref:2-amino-4-hydroxy-6- hydroxymethyldihydropteridine diphosphokinase n=1 Tax=Allosphingosinicella sp. TaxID=2823234 RepID=UPI002ED85440
MAPPIYAIALGSNRRSRHGSPADTVKAAAEALGVERLSALHSTTALGPAGRGFTNAAALVSSARDPADFLAELKAIERSFGRRPGRRWGPRVLDLDIILWSEGFYEAQGLVIPHPSFRERRFVLDPLAEIAPNWRDPLTGLTVRQLSAGLAARRPVDRHPPRA